MWVLTLNYSTSMHDTMTNLIGIVTKSSEQHKGLRASRRKQDKEHGLKFTAWLQERHPFGFEDENLNSLSTGIISMTSKDSVNCVDAEELGLKIQKELDVSLSAATIKRKNQIKPMASLLNTVKVDEVHVYVSTTVLFTRLAAITKREENEEKYFDYELTKEPMSLFKNNLMRNPDKPSLRKVLLKDDNAIGMNDISKNCIFVIDGGALLHRVCWRKGMTFSEIGKLYATYVRKHYNDAIVVFNGSNNESMKSYEQRRKTGNGPQCSNVVIVELNKVQFSHAKFLSNEHNKSELIKLISKFLRDDSQNVIKCVSDADTKIVSTTLDYSTVDGRTIVAVTDDTDIAVMLLYHCREEMKDLILFQPCISTGWNMKVVSPKVTSVKDYLLFVDGMSGCDTTSAPYGKRKISFMNLVNKPEMLKDISDMMSNVWAYQVEIGISSIATFTVKYGVRKGDTLKRYSGEN